ncbi:MAG: hypothetical protein Q4A66_02345 [Eubacteriales bacterium]|nr:hypothetical protein [Eubacteriales bacterium]
MSVIKVEIAAQPTPAAVGIDIGAAGYYKPVRLGEDTIGWEASTPRLPAVDAIVIPNVEAAGDAAAAANTAASNAQAAAAAAAASSGAADTSAEAADAATQRASSAASSAEEASDRALAAAERVEEAIQRAEEAAAAANDAAANIGSAAEEATAAASAADDAAKEANTAAAAADGAAEEANAAAANAAEQAALAAEAAQSAAELSDELGAVSERLDALESDLDGILAEQISVNRFVMEDWTSGYCNASGAVFDSDTYHYSRPFPVSEGDVVRGYHYSASSDSLTARGFRFVTAYDAEGNVLKEKGSSSSSATVNGYTVPEGVAEVVLSWELALGEGYANELTINVVPEEYSEYREPYAVLSETAMRRYVRLEMTINTAEGIDAFYEGMLRAYTEGDMDVFIRGGTLAYTNEFVDALRAEGKRGVPVGNGCRYFFATGTGLYCEYTGENAADVAEYFSPLDTWSSGGDFEIHNLDLTAKNTVYAVHDEANGAEGFCRHVFQNCNIALDNSALGTAGSAISKALGGGLGLSEEVILEHCVFAAVNPAKTGDVQNDVSYHGADSSASSEVKIVVSGCYFADGNLRMSDALEEVQAPYPRMLYSGNSAAAAPSYPAAWDVRAWNNEVRG